MWRPVSPDITGTTSAKVNTIGSEARDPVQTLIKILAPSLCGTKDAPIMSMLTAERSAAQRRAEVYLASIFRTERVLDKELLMMKYKAEPDYKQSRSCVLKRYKYRDE